MKGNRKSNKRGKLKPDGLRPLTIGVSRPVECETETIVRELIRLFVVSLRDLNEGKPIPLSWREWLNAELGGSKPGPPPELAVTERQQRWARKMHRFRQENPSGKATPFAKELADLESEIQPQGFTTSDVFNAESKYQWLILSEEANRRLGPKAASYADRRLRIVKWISDGMTRGIGYDAPEVLNLNEALRLGLRSSKSTRRLAQEAARTSLDVEAERRLGALSEPEIQQLEQAIAREQRKRALTGVETPRPPKGKKTNRSH